MSWFDYRVSLVLAAADPPFDALIMAAMRKADSSNAAKLAGEWPHVWEELQARYNAPGGYLEGEPVGVHRMTDDELRAGVNEFTQDDPPPYNGPSRLSGHDRDDIDGIMKGRGDWFSAQLLRLIAKSDPRNRAALAMIYPDHVEAYEKWFRDGGKS